MGEFTDKAKGHANEAAGEMKRDSDNPQTRDEGKMQKEKGELQKEKGELEGARDSDR